MYLQLIESRVLLHNGIECSPFHAMSIVPGIKSSRFVCLFNVRGAELSNVLRCHWGCLRIITVEPIHLKQIAVPQEFDT